MRVYTKAVSQWDEELQRYVTDESASEWYEYDGPVELAKGEQTADAQRQKELQLQQQAIDRQNFQQDYVKGLVQPFVNGNGQGYDPALLSALQTQFMNTNDAAYGSASGSLRSALLARGAGGGDMPIGGDTVRGFIGLNSARAGSQSQGLQNINLQNLQAALNNKWNALSILNGQPAQLDTQIGSTSNAASSALDSYIKAKSNGFLQSFGQGLGGALGKGLGQMGIGAASGALNSVSGTNWFGGSNSGGGGGGQ